MKTGECFGSTYVLSSERSLVHGEDDVEEEVCCGHCEGHVKPGNI